MRRIVFATVVAIAAHRGWACETAVLPPARFPLAPDSVALMGIVTGYREATADVLDVHHPPGLVVKVVDLLMRSRIGTVVEVYPLGTGHDCKSVAREADELRTQYPIGATVTVVGTVVAMSPAGGPTVNVVATQADDFGHVARIPTSVPRGRDGYLDFRAYQDGYQDPASWSSDAAWSNAQRSWFEDYEFLRCLAALAPTAGGVKSSEMLESLAFYSRYRGVSREFATASYGHLLEWAGVSPSERRRLMRAFKSAIERAHER